ncbi:MAG TPA: hypothetical protein VK717_00250 [Opitutaceae bacterium]|jgi:hypothetical protein|nr:hypothetical protein [Opitutaceae bacterium]
MALEVPVHLRPIISDRYEFFQGRLISVTGKNRIVLDYETSLRPVLEFIQQYFTSQIRDEIVKKLRNPSQLLDTVFELNCMCVLGRRLPIKYEPRLSNGRLADFGVIVPPILPLYIECKNPNRVQNLAREKVDRHNKQLAHAVSDTDLKHHAWQQGLRIEFVPARHLNQREMKALREAIICAAPNMIDAKLWQPIPGLAIHFVPRSSGYVTKSWMQTCQVVVSDTPINVTMENAALAFHAWPSLERTLLRTITELLADARRQLSGIRAPAMGLIWLNVQPSASLAKMLEDAVARQEFDNILGILTQDRLYHRTDRTRAAVKLAGCLEAAQWGKDVFRTSISWQFFALLNRLFF